jgi:hypothetical protein
MPKVLEDRQNNLTVYIYFDDHIPAHVHVFCGSKQSRNQLNIKIALGSETERPKLLMKDQIIKTKDVIAALNLIAKHQQELLEKWKEIHGS